MKTVWEYSLDTETQRLLHHARQIAVGFYKLNGFMVVPFGTKVSDPSTIAIPDLEFTKIQRFWENVGKIDISNFPLSIEPKLFDQTKEMLGEYKLPIPDFSKTKEVWDRAQSEIIEAIENVLPNKRGLINQITIHPSIFGTQCSFNKIDERRKAIVYLRSDGSIYQITEALLSILTLGDVVGKLGGVWQESEIVVDFLLTQTSIYSVLQKYQDPSLYVTTIKGIRSKEKSNQLKSMSDQFYKKMGVMIEDKTFEIINNYPSFNSSKIENLTSKEESLIKLLIDKSNTIVSFDTISDEIFESDLDFSLETIAKTIQRLRDKLEQNGISASYLQTVRKRGYVLRN